jgi:hypothetical protein
MLLAMIFRALITRGGGSVDCIFAKLTAFFKTKDRAVNSRLTDPASRLRKSLHGIRYGKMLGSEGVDYADNLVLLFCIIALFFVFQGLFLVSADLLSYTGSIVGINILQSSEEVFR